MPAYRLPNDKKRWYFTFYYQGKKYKKTKWDGHTMDSRTEALQCERLCLAQLEQEIKKDGKALNIYGLFEEYMTTTKGTLKETTLHNYDKFRRIYLSMIPNKKIWDLTPGDIAAWKNKMSKVDDSNEYINRQLNVMKKVLEYGHIVYDLPGKLQISLLEPIKNNKPIVIEEKKKNLPADKFEAMVGLLDTGKPDQLYFYTILVVLYYTGLRIGELAALEVADYKNHCLYVTKDYVRVNGHDYIQAPKNQNSVRSVMMDEKTEAILKRYIETFEIKEGILFHRTGPYMDQQHLRQVMTKLSKLAGLDTEYDIHPHGLRHSHASNLRLLGYDAFTISQRLGNTPTTAADTYIHSEVTEQAELVKKLRK